MRVHSTIIAQYPHLVSYKYSVWDLSQVTINSHRSKALELELLYLPSYFCKFQALELRQSDQNFNTRMLSLYEVQIYWCNHVFLKNGGRGGEGNVIYLPLGQASSTNLTCHRWILSKQDMRTWMFKEWINNTDWMLKSGSRYPTLAHDSIRWILHIAWWDP